MFDKIERYLTPFKYARPVLAPSGIQGSFDAQAVDCPFVFSQNGRYFMLYVGFSGKGYRTALAESDNLFDWKSQGVLLGCGQMADQHANLAGVWILKKDDLFEPPVPQMACGNYWMVYHRYPGIGYEAGPAEIGLAYTKDPALLRWSCLDQPILSWKTGDEWERGGLYKGCIISDRNRYFLFYNAKDREQWPWHENIGLAISDDLLHWTRYRANPVLAVSAGRWDSVFAADPAVYRDGDHWVMYYYGYDGVHAQNGLAFSKDLLHWEKYPQPILPYGRPGELDSTHAHKPSVLFTKGSLHQFYCAVRPSVPSDPAANPDPTGQMSAEFRCISIASSQRQQLFSREE